MNFLEILLLDVKGVSVIVAVAVAIIVAVLKFKDLLFPPTPIDPENLCGTYTGSIQTLHPTDVNRMIKNYRDTRDDLIQNGNAICNTDSVVFSLEEMKKFIFHAEKNTINRGLSLNSNSLGIRFYYAAYSLAPGAGYPNQSDCAGRRTLVMVPTFKAANGLDIDFDANDPNFIVSPAFSNLLQNNGVEVSALNHGSLFPPMC